MEVHPVGKIRADVMSEAAAMQIPWDDLTSRWYGMIENAWLADLAWKRKRAKGG
jgi:hypothetical protein